MAYGSGYAGGYADAVADNSTLEGASALVISQTAALVYETLALVGQSDWAASQTAALGLAMAVTGQSDWVISQSGDLVLPAHDVSLAGTAALTITQSASVIFSMSLAGSADLPVSVADADLVMMELILLGAEARLAIRVSGTLFVLRPPTPPPSKVVEALVKRRSIIMPTPSLTSGRPS